MPAVSSSLEKIRQNPPISPALRPETIRHPDKRSKLENDATCGLADTGGPGLRRPSCLASKREMPSRDTHPLQSNKVRAKCRERIQTNHCRTVTRHGGVPT